MNKGTRPPKSATPIERIKRRVEYQWDTGCWISDYPMTNTGYTRVKISGKFIMCHRFTYEYYIGPIPPSFQVDHLCKNRACCNPLHLEAVTVAENIRRSDAASGIWARTGACKWGHPISQAHTSPRGVRKCRACHARRVREGRLRKMKESDHVEK